MQRSEFDFDVISGPATPRPPRTTAEAPAAPLAGQATSPQPGATAAAPAK